MFAALLALVVLAASLTGTPGGATAVGVDKLLHAAGYAALAYAVAAAAEVRTPRVLAGVVLAVTAFGVGIEAVQPLVGRNASAADALANLAGAVAGALAWWQFRRHD